MNASAQNSASVPVRSKKRVKDSEQHINVLEHEREMMKIQTDIKTSPAVHRKSSKKSQDAPPLSMDTLTLSLSPPPIQVAPCTPASAAEREKSHHPLGPGPLVTSRSDLFSQLALLDIADEDEVQIISPFELKDTRHRRPKPMMKKQPMNTEMLESERSEKKLNNAKKTDHEGSSPYIPYEYTVSSFITV